MRRLVTALCVFLALGGLVMARGNRETEKSGNQEKTETVKPGTPEQTFIPTKAQEKLKKFGFEYPTEATAAPDFTLKDMEGKSVSLSSLRGNIVFLNFWATWCPPCKAEMPSMQKLHEVLKNEKFVMTAVNLQENPQDVSSFLNKQGYSFKVLLDETGEVGGMYGIESIPTTYIVDKKGDIIGRLIGSREWDGDDVLSVFRELAAE